jgi:hypothetical protein
MQTKAEAPAIAVIGIGCYYPGANNLKKLWENILARRREFRHSQIIDYPCLNITIQTEKHQIRLMEVELLLSMVLSLIGQSGAFLKELLILPYIVHWLALEVAIQALEDAGYTRENVPTERTGVILGNTLTGEQVRSSRCDCVGRLFVEHYVQQLIRKVYRSSYRNPCRSDGKVLQICICSYYRGYSSW